jgi:excinuclease UvrABC nuclease subunit
MTIEQIVIDKTNVGSLPQKKSVYSIWAQSQETDKPINCRYVGETDNLQERIQTHFSPQEENVCLKEFMQSNSTKIMIYELMPNSTKEERLAKEEEWIKKYNPKCNK